MANIDENILRIARKLAIIQKVNPVTVVVPKPVASAFRELDSARALSIKVLHGDHAARDQLISRIGGRTPTSHALRPKSLALSPRASILLAQAQRGPMDGLRCLGDAQSNMV